MYNTVRPFISDSKGTIQVVYKKASVSSKQSTKYTIRKQFLLLIQASKTRQSL